MNCPYCGSLRLSTSRLRPSDFPKLVIGRLPMRCRECDVRFFAWLMQVLLSKWVD